MPAATDPRAFHFKVNEAHNKAHNEYTRDTRRFSVAAYLLAIVLVALTVFFLWAVGGYTWTLLIAAVVLLMAVGLVVLGATLPKRLGSAQENFDRYPLCASVIAKLQPNSMVLMGLVNTTIDPEGEPRWALATRTVTRIAGHERRVGEHVPSVAVAGKSTKRDPEHWSAASPTPIAWGTPDAGEVHRAKLAIPKSQWSQLDRLTSRVDAVEATRHNFLVL